MQLLLDTESDSVKNANVHENELNSTYLNKKMTQHVTIKILL